MTRCPICKAPVTPQATGRPRVTCSDRCRQAAFRRRRVRPLFLAQTVEWETPRELFAELNAEFGFTLDACACASNAKCGKYFTRADDGLAQEWHGRVWMNPPYGRPLGAWMRKALDASRSTAEVVVCLVPARTDTAWWHETAVLGEVRFVRGRLRFGEAANSATFASVVVVFRSNKTRNERVPA